jgi:hypothetical protein
MQLGRAISPVYFLPPLCYRLIMVSFHADRATQLKEVEKHSSAYKALRSAEMIPAIVTPGAHGYVVTCEMDNAKLLYEIAARL